MLVGDGLIEQMQKYGYLEYRLTVQNQGKSLHFRNIGWTGDTPAGIARDGLGTRQAGHEPANEGWVQLQKQITEMITWQRQNRFPSLGPRSRVANQAIDREAVQPPGDSKPRFSNSQI